MTMGARPIQFNTEEHGHWHAWARAVPHVSAALEVADGTHLVVDVLAGIVQGQFHLWIGKKSAAVTEIVEYPRVRDMNVFLAGGDLEEIRAWQKPGGSLEKWAFEANECNRLSFCGRAFDRVYEGWDRTHVHCVRSKPQ